jgi:hypothetical protein
MNHQCVFIERASAMVMAEKSHSRRNRHPGLHTWSRPAARANPEPGYRRRATQRTQRGPARGGACSRGTRRSGATRLPLHCRHSWTRFRFHRREDRVDRLGALISLRRRPLLCTEPNGSAVPAAPLGRLGVARLPFRHVLPVTYYRRHHHQPRNPGSDACRAQRRCLPHPGDAHRKQAK